MSQSLDIVILAAGKGTRMHSHTSKMLHHIAGIPLVAHPVHTALSLQPGKIVVVVGHHREQVQIALQQRFPQIPLSFAVQEQQLGTGHAVMTAQSQIVGGAPRFLLLSGDVPLLTAKTLQDLQQLHEQSNAVVSFLSFVTPEPKGYGRIIRDGEGRVRCIREHRDCSPQQLTIQECNAGIYLFDKDFLFQNLSKIDTNNAQQEFYLTDIVEMAAQAGQFAQVVVVQDEYEVMGVNDRYQLSLLEHRWQQDKRRFWMQSGVTFRLSETTFLHYDVTLGQDTEIEPHCCLLGQTHIGPNCHIGAGSYLQDAHIPAGTRVSTPPTKI